MIAGHIAKGNISGREAFVLLQALMEATDSPELLVKFEKMCIGMLGLVNLRDRREAMLTIYHSQQSAMHHMKKIGAEKGSLADVLLGSLVGQMNVVHEEALRRLGEEIIEVENMINEEENNAGKAACN